MAAALLGSVREVVREPDGRYRLASMAEREAGGLLAGEAGRRVATAIEPARQATAGAVPSFDAWLAERRRAEAAAPAPEGETPRRPRRARGGRGQALIPASVALAGDDECLQRLSYAVVDVETTGGSPYSGHRITEIAVVVVKEGRIAEVFETLVNPERSIPPMISQLTNITWEMVRDKPPFREVAPRLVDVLQGHVFVAHNVNFDWKFVTAEVERASGQQLAGRRLCTVRLARKLLPELPRRTLGHVAAHFDVDKLAEAYFAEHHPRMVWRHRAAGDAVATAHCLLRMLDRASDHGCTTWGGLDQLLSGGTSRTKTRRRGALAMPRAVDKDTTA
jgi:DNA polymerase-3 subunit epsilon